MGIGMAKGSTRTDLSQSTNSVSQKRNLSIHEYQSVQLLNSVSSGRLDSSIDRVVGAVAYSSQYGIPTPKALPAFSASEAESVAKGFGTFASTGSSTRLTCAGTNELVIKAQVLAGGRGKGHFDSGFQGGVQMVDSYVPPPFTLPNAKGLIHVQPGSGQGLCREDVGTQTHHQADRCRWTNL
jgi:succinyl-CoA synthetase beta subunit